MNILKKDGVVDCATSIEPSFLYVCVSRSMYVHVHDQVYVCMWNEHIMHYCLYVYLGWREMD